MISLDLTEAQFQEMVVARAKARGWLVYHTHDSRRSAHGFPDLIIARNGVVIAAELKSMTGSASKAQLDWLDALEGGLNGGTFIWRPSSWPSICTLLDS